MPPNQEPNHMLAYTHIPPSAHLIPEPNLDPPPAPASNTQSGPATSAPKIRLASFPPPNVGVKDPPPGKKGTGKDTSGTSSTGGGLGSALSSGVTDMFISHLLPSTLPSKSTTQGPLPQPGKIRTLSSQRETLALPAMTNSFRRFVARCGTIFWVEDRVEEVLYWRKPVWTWSWMLGWGFICFYPRIILLIPFCTLILILLNVNQKPTPSIPTPLPLSPTIPSTSLKSSILSNPLASSLAASLTQNSDPSVNPKARSDVRTDTNNRDPEKHTTAVDAQGREIQAISGQPESGVDYYLNLQGIQNFMALFSDIHDAVLPYIALVVPSMPSPSPPPTTFPLSPTHIMILLLPPTILLPLIPMRLLSYLLLPLGIVPPIIFHPAFLPALERLRKWEGISQRRLRYWRGVAERWVLTDRLDDSIAQSEIREVRVWENQRLDPSWLSTAGTGTSRGKANEKRNSFNGLGEVAEKKDLDVPPESAWSSAHLKSFERSAWVRALPKEVRESLWFDGPVDSVTGEGEGDTGNRGKVALSLVDGWSFVPAEDWRVDYVAEWDRDGGDEAGWIYTDDEWKHPLDLPVDASITDSNDPRGSRYKVTRRRQWWRRAYSTK